MADGRTSSFLYEQCDVPEGESLQSWKRRQVSPQRKAQVTGGFIAAIATLAPIVLSVRGTRPR
jgi:hypothetical protein